MDGAPASELCEKVEVVPDDGIVLKVVEITEVELLNVKASGIKVGVGA